MSRQILSFIVKFILLILVQAVIFNNIVLFNTAIPFVFIYIIISMPITWGTNASMTIAFLAGFIIDVFANTQGVNTLSCTILAFARKPIFHLYMQHDENLSGAKPSLQSMGSNEFLKYAVTMTLAYCFMVFTIDAFAVFSFFRYLAHIFGSAIFTSVLIYALDTIFTRQHEKRL